MLRELEINSKEEVVIESTKVLHGDSFEGLEKNHGIFNIAGVLAEIQTERPQNTSLVDSHVVQLYHSHFINWQLEQVDWPWRIHSKPGEQRNVRENRKRIAQK
jgi:hypothetical protein